jgi:hypothetical protein
MPFNWLQKIAQDSWYTDGHYYSSFYLINGELHFFNSLHADWLERAFGLDSRISTILTKAFPRGRLIEVGHQIIIEMSPQLEPYKSKILHQLEISPWRHIRWKTTDEHYAVYSPQDLTQKLLHNQLYAEYLNEQSRSFIEQYLPEVHIPQHREVA